jgi:hypothetical protein
MKGKQRRAIQAEAGTVDTVLDWHLCAMQRLKLKYHFGSVLPNYISLV